MQFDRQNLGSMARQRTLESEDGIYSVLNRGNYRADVSGDRMRGDDRPISTRASTFRDAKGVIAPETKDATGGIAICPAPSERKAMGARFAIARHIS